MVKAVIFDMDGVIIDSEPAYKQVERDMFNELGIPVTQEQHMKYVGVKTSRMWAELKGMFGFDASVEELTLEERRRYAAKLHEWKDIRPIPGIAGLLAGLRKKGVKTAIASSSDIEEIGIVAAKLQYEKYFPVMVSGEQVPNGKPDPDIFLHTAQLLGVRPEDCIVIEDSTNGATAAKRAGMKCIGFRNPNSGDQDLSMADMVVDRIEEIGAHLL